MRLLQNQGIRVLPLFLLFVFNIVYISAQTPPPIEECADEPIKYVGDKQPDKRFFDGNLPHAVGVHHYQAFRANRTHPAEGGEIGWTYNHQPYLAYWNGRFYFQYLSNLIQEHDPPGRTLLMTSEDGKHWNDPVIVFPEYDLPEIKYKNYTIPAGTKSVMHQRMGFYVAPNGKLLTLAFYGFCATPYHSPNAGNGLGRVVREIKKDGTYGPIYFIRYNRHAGWNETNTNYPFYKKSKDKEFIDACEALLADKLISLQWWEEDRAKDGFYVIDPGDVKNAAYFSADIVTSKSAGKAFNFYYRADGVIVGFWKNQYSALSPDNGKTWTKISQNKTLWTTGAKTWVQRTEDGRYAIVHNHSATKRNRFPMVALTSNDGHIFEEMLCLRGEVPQQRYQGIHKNIGPQYYRGIIQGNGNPPGNEMWIVYSLNKEDMWIASMRVPITGKVNEHVSQDFEEAEKESDLSLWNFYITKWASMQVVYDNSSRSKCLEFRDGDPYDYVLAERIFPESKIIDIGFRFNVKEAAFGHGLEIEVQDQHGSRPMLLRIDQKWLGVDHENVSPKPVPIETDKWYDVLLKMDCALQKYDLYVNRNLTINDIPFTEKTESLERIVFRTGPYRGYVPPNIIEGKYKRSGLIMEDQPGGDEKAPKCVYLIDDVSTKVK